MGRSANSSSPTNMVEVLTRASQGELKKPASGEWSMM